MEGTATLMQRVWALFFLFFSDELVTLNFTKSKKKARHTPLKTNMSPENQWLEDVSPTKIVPFWGTC